MKKNNLNEPEYQGQHRVPQVYLKQFGYQKDGVWWLSVYQKGKESTDNVVIGSFTKETNIFDLPFQNVRARRYFEKLSGKLENHYRTLISNLRNQKQLTKRDKDFLCHFIPNMLCRSKVFRRFIDSLIRTSDTRDKFLNEITLLRGDITKIKSVLKKLPIDYQLNFVILPLMDHMITVFRRFNMVVIRDFNNIGWQTTDNPVYMDKQGHHEWIIPFEAEIYFPLSKDFCIFMFCDQSEIKTNPLRNLKINRINEIDNRTFNNINYEIAFNYSDFLIMSVPIENTDVTSKYKKMRLLPKDSSIFHWGWEGGGAQIYRLINDSKVCFIEQYSYMDFDENDDEVWRQGEIEHPSFEAFWQEATVDQKWFTRRPVYIHDDCKTVIRKSLNSIDLAGLSEYERNLMEDWNNTL